MAFHPFGAKFLELYPLRPLLPALASLSLLAACSGSPKNEAPPRVTTPINIESAPSTIAVLVTAKLDSLAAALDRDIPRKLWSIDKPGQTCVASKGIDLGIAKVKTPRIKCRIVGTVTRGKLSLSGSGQTIRAAIPLHAVLRAEDIGGIISRETATADAMAHAVIRLNLDKDWTPRGTVDLQYDWTDTPHAEILGQRIDFTSQADAKLKPVIARLERDLPGELRKLNIRKQVREGWASAFTVLSLNRKDPPVWLRVKPTALHYGGYDIDGSTLRLRLGMEAVTESFVGNKPGAPKPAPLPPMTPLQNKAGRVAFVIPVVANYKELEPVLMKALTKRAARPIEVPGIGPVTANFKRVTIYGTEKGRMAVGVTFAAHPQGNPAQKASGTVWLTGKPVNATNSRVVQFKDLSISGTTDVTGGDLILDLANAPGITALIASSLEQNFQKDFGELLKKVERAIAEKREGQFTIRADIDRVQTGTISATGQGLFLPTRIEGTARVNLR